MDTCRYCGNILPEDETDFCDYYCRKRWREEKDSNLSDEKSKNIDRLKRMMDDGIGY